MNNNNHTPDLSDKVMKSILTSILKKQGYKVSKNSFYLPDDNRETKRDVHNLSKAERIFEHYNFLNSNSSLIGNYIIDGKDLEVENIKPQLIQVKSGTIWEILFKWWNLTWWSLPYERAYGRQLRYIVWDKYHESIIGLIGLQSPILSWSIRDKYLGITPEKRDYWVNQSLNAQRLGALPPYNDILGGKLVALLLSSKKVSRDYQKKYSGLKTEIKQRKIPARLLFVTTTGAYGKSSIYTRLKYSDEYVAKFIGYSKGSGSFHIPNIFFEKIISYLESKDIDTKRGYGSGPSRKMRLIDTALTSLGFEKGVNHGVKRAIYLFPMVDNLKEVIDKRESPSWHKWSEDELTDYWKAKWALNRAETHQTYLTFNSKEFLNSQRKDIEDKNNSYKEFYKWMNTK